MYFQYELQQTVILFQSFQYPQRYITSKPIPPLQSYFKHHFLFLLSSQIAFCIRREKKRKYIKSQSKNVFSRSIFWFFVVDSFALLPTRSRREHNIITNFNFIVIFASAQTLKRKHTLKEIQSNQWQKGKRKKWECGANARRNALEFKRGCGPVDWNKRRGERREKSL